jgi:hypothetical protein
MAILFDADYSTLIGNWDVDLWDFAGEHGVKINATRLPTDGPGGTACVEFAQIPGGEVAPQSSCGGQFDFGHGINLADHAAGVSRFARGRLFVTSASNFRATAWGSFPTCGTHTRSRMKWLIIGSGSGTPNDRIILNLDGIEDGDPQFEVIFDGDGTPTTTAGFSRGVWHSWQIEWTWNGASSFVKLWLDSDTYASPLFNHVGNGSRGAADNGEFRLGAFMNEGLRTGGVFTWRHAAVEVGDTFDSGWHASLSGETSSPRMVRSAGRFVSPR